MNNISNVKLSVIPLSATKNIPVSVFYYQQYRDLPDKALEAVNLSLYSVYNGIYAISADSKKSLVKIFFFRSVFDINNAKINIIECNCDSNQLEDIKCDTKLHLFYAFSILYQYTEWSSTATYDKYIEMMTKLSLPSILKCVSTPLYRGLLIREENYSQLINGRSIPLKPRIGTSWSVNPDEAYSIVREYKERRGADGKIVVIKLSSSPTTNVIINGYNLPKIKAISNLMKEAYIPHNAFNEVILQGNGGLTNITNKIII